MYAQPVNVATPLVTLSGATEQWSPPPPLLAARLMGVEESVVSVLPKASSSATTTENGVPATLVAGGAVV